MTSKQILFQSEDAEHVHVCVPGGYICFYIFVHYIYIYFFFNAGMDTRTLLFSI